jgi:hypothetical protein
VSGVDQNWPESVAVDAHVRSASNQNRFPVRLQA